MTGMHEKKKHSKPQQKWSTFIKTQTLVTLPCVLVLTFLAVSGLRVNNLAI